MKITYFPGAFILVLMTAPFAAASSQISLVGTGSYYNVAATPDALGIKTSPALGLGGGLLLETSIVPMAQLQIGALYFQHRFDLKTTLPAITDSARISMQGVQIPALIRFGSAAVSIGVGGYERGVGGVKCEATGVFSCPYASATRTDAGIKNSDYGALASVALGLGPLLIDVRYAYGLNNLVPDGATTLQGYNSIRLGIYKLLLVLDCNWIF